MKIDAALNFVIPLFHDENDDAPYAYVCATPLSQAAFEANFRVLVRTFKLVADEGGSANRFARLYMRDAALSLTGPDGNADQICAPVLNEIGRLSSVVLSTKNGWESIPLQQAIDAKLLDEGDAGEAISACVFFTLALRAAPKTLTRGFTESGLRTWSAQSSSLSPTEWIASLRTSTETANSGATEAASAPAPGSLTISVPGLAPRTS